MKTQDIKNIARAMPQVAEKLSGGQHKLDKDKDGDIDGKDFAMMRKKKNEKVTTAAGQEVDKPIKHDCATHVEHAEWGEGQPISGMHTIVETTEGEGYVTHYDVMFEHGIEKDVAVEDLTILAESSHGHSINASKKKKMAEDEVEVNPTLKTKKEKKGTETSTQVDEAMQHKDAKAAATSFAKLHKNLKVTSIGSNHFVHHKDDEDGAEAVQFSHKGGQIHVSHDAGATGGGTKAAKSVADAISHASKMSGIKEEVEQVNEDAKVAATSFAKLHKNLKVTSFGNKHFVHHKDDEDGTEAVHFMNKGGQIHVTHDAGATGGGTKKAKSVADAISHASKMSGIKEEAMQIDELDKKTLGSYIKKAGPDAVKQTAQAKRHADAGDMADKDRDMYKAYAKSQRAMDKAKNRQKGISKAVDKLTASYKTESKNAALMKKLAKASAPSEKGKKAVSLPKAPFEIPKKEGVEWAVYNKIKENRAAHYKSATAPEEMDSKASGNEKDFKAKHKVDTMPADLEKKSHDGASAAGRVTKKAPARNGDNAAGDKIKMAVDTTKG